MASPLHPTDRSGALPPIRIRGACRHNLAGVDLDLPRAGLTVLIGPSGSGKTSLALDTVHATARARLSQALGLAATSTGDEDLSVVDDLPLTLATSDRQRPAPDLRVVDVLALTPHLVRHGRLAGTQHCPRCDRALPVQRADEIVQTLLDELDGQRLVLLAPLARGRVGGVAALVEEVGRQGFTRVRLDGTLQRVEEIGGVDGRQAHDLDVVVDRVRVGPDRIERIEEAVGVALSAGKGRLIAVSGDRELSMAERPWCPDHPELVLEAMQDDWLALGARAACPRCRGRGDLAGAPCARCGGDGLRPEVRHWRVGPMAAPWPTVLETAIDDLPELLAAGRDGPAPDAAEQAEPSLPGLSDEPRLVAAQCRQVGLAALPAGRRVNTLSSTERRRLLLVAALRLVQRMPGSLLIADEPLAGLDETTAEQVETLLCEADVPVLAVSHRRSLVDRADHSVAFGPGAGHEGGRVVWQGPGAALPQALLPSPPAPAVDASTPSTPHTIDFIVADRPRLRLERGAITALTAPPGGGKSRWIQALVAALRAAVGDKPDPDTIGVVEGAADIAAVLRFDRSPPGRSARSCVATILGVWTPLRTLLAATRTARIQGFDAARFRFDQPGGRCEACQGTGLHPVSTDEPCPVCSGHRFQRDTLRVRLKGRTVAELLDSDVTTAGDLFAAHRKLGPALQAARLVGLGYLPLGQPSATLSGGEAQRLRLARELARAGSIGDELRRLDDRVLVLDAPTVGLHPRDLRPVVDVLRRLADRGATVVVGTVSPALLAEADRVVQLSPPPPLRR